MKEEGGCAIIRSKLHQTGSSQAKNGNGMRHTLAALALTLGLLLTGCAPGRGPPSEFAPEESGERLVVYTSHKEEVWWPIVQEFESRTGIWVEVVRGAPASCWPACAGRRTPRQADVMFGGGVDSLEAYQDCFSPTSVPVGRGWTRPCARRGGTVDSLLRPAGGAHLQHQTGGPGADHRLAGSVFSGMAGAHRLL